MRGGETALKWTPFSQKGSLASVFDFGKRAAAPFGSQFSAENKICACGGVVVIQRCLLVIYGLLACDNGAYIERDDALRIINDWESGHVPDAVTHSLFNEVNDFERHFIYIIGSDYRFKLPSHTKQAPNLFVQRLTCR